jgi:hypothetical protein
VVTRLLAVLQARDGGLPFSALCKIISWIPGMRPGGLHCYGSLYKVVFRVAFQSQDTQACIGCLALRHVCGMLELLQSVLHIASALTWGKVGSPCHEYSSGSSWLCLAVHVIASVPSLPELSSMRVLPLLETTAQHWQQRRPTPKVMPNVFVVRRGGKRRLS